MHFLRIFLFLGLELHERASPGVDSGVRNLNSMSAQMGKGLDRSNLGRRELGRLHSAYSCKQSPQSYMQCERNMFDPRAERKKVLFSLQFCKSEFTLSQALCRHQNCRTCECHKPVAADARNGLCFAQYRRCLEVQPFLFRVELWRYVIEQLEIHQQYAPSVRFPAAD